MALTDTGPSPISSEEQTIAPGPFTPRPPSIHLSAPVRLSVLIPCYNEEKTLEQCMENLLGIKNDRLLLEIIIIDDKSNDGSLAVARSLESRHPEITVLEHDRNRGKGAALRTGIERATGEIVAVQDADLEYDPNDLRRLLNPILAGKADVVYGSRFVTGAERRVLYFWHSIANRFLTLASNMFTDVNLTDMETCYKVFRREVIRRIEIEEDRFGFEPEITAKVAQLKARIYEIGISYHGRTYQEGKKIGWKDAVRTLYCIFKYNTFKAPAPLQFLVYTFAAAVSAVLVLPLFLLLVKLHAGVTLAAVAASGVAAVLNYLLCVLILFRPNARWSTAGELATYSIPAAASCVVNALSTGFFIDRGVAPWLSNISVSTVVFFAVFLFCRYVVFPERRRMESL